MEQLDLLRVRAFAEPSLLQREMGRRLTLQVFRRVIPSGCHEQLDDIAVTGSAGLMQGRHPCPGGNVFRQVHVHALLRHHSQHVQMPSPCGQMDGGLPSAGPP